MEYEIKDNMYLGRTCRKCGLTLRYKSDKRCVHCRHEQNATAWKNKVVTLSNDEKVNKPWWYGEPSVVKEIIKQITSTAS
ncbi:hypothetical protein PXY30_004445 [Salmonella enterica]|nr:hypothetical protein [Salmonella enterica]